MELNGHIYSKEKFPEYKFRAKVRITIVDDERYLDIYTTDGSRSRTWSVLNDHKTGVVTNSPTIIHWTTKEQDELTPQMLEELFAENL